MAADGGLIAGNAESTTRGGEGTRWLLVSSFQCFIPGCNWDNAVLKYDWDTGAFLGVHASSVLGPYGLAIHPVRGTLLVASRGEDLIDEFDPQTGEFLGNFVIGDAANGLHFPQYIAFSPHTGNLLVTSTQTIGFLDRVNGVIEFDWRDGSFVRVFADGGPLGQACPDPKCLFGPTGMTFGPNGNVYVTSGLNDGSPQSGVVIEYMGDTAEYVNYFDSTLLVNPSGIAIRPAGTVRENNVLVTTQYPDPQDTTGIHGILEFSWITYELVIANQFWAGGMAKVGPLLWDDDTNLLVGDRLFWHYPPYSDRIRRHHGDNGAFLSYFTPQGNTALRYSTALLDVAFDFGTYDADSDGDVDLEDYAKFQACFGLSPDGSCMAPFDDNLTGTIDWADHKALLENLTGPTS